jgi:hypothetical protein
MVTLDGGALRLTEPVRLVKVVRLPKLINVKVILWL